MLFYTLSAKDKARVIEVIRRRKFKGETDRVLARGVRSLYHPHQSKGLEGHNGTTAVVRCPVTKILLDSAKEIQQPQWLGGGVVQTLGEPVVNAPKMLVFDVLDAKGRTVCRRSLTVSGLVDLGAIRVHFGWQIKPVA